MRLFARSVVFPANSAGLDAETANRIGINVLILISSSPLCRLGGTGDRFRGFAPEALLRLIFFRDAAAQARVSLFNADYFIGRKRNEGDAAGRLAVNPVLLLL